MPTSLSGLANDEMNVRWKEPLLTEALNHKAQVVVPRGIFRGFRLGTHANPLTVSVTTDSTGLHIAQYEPANGYTLQVRRTGGTFALDLTPLVGQTVVIAIFAKYAQNQTTTGEIRAYTLAEWNAVPVERPELVVLGTVVVPGAGLIPLANISSTRRTSAWANIAQEAARWPNTIENGSFEAGSTTGNVVYAVAPWQTFSDGPGTMGTNYDLRRSTAQSRSGLSCFEHNVITTGTDVGWALQQYLGVPVAANLTRVRVRFFYRVMQVPTGGGLQIFLTWGGTAGTAVLSDAAALDLTSTNANIDREFDQIFLAPANATHLQSFGFLKTAALTYGAAGPSIRIDDVQVFVEPFSNVDDPAAEMVRRRRLWSDLLFAREGEAWTNLRARPLLQMSGSQNRLDLARQDLEISTQNDHPDLRIYGVLEEIGRGKLNTDSIAASTPRIKTPFRTAGGTFTLIHEINPNGGTEGSVRMYVSRNDAEAIWTVNARFDFAGNQWVKDVNGERAHRFKIGSGVEPGLSLETQDPAVNSWVEGAWQDRFFSGGFFDLLNTFNGILTLGDSYLVNATQAAQPRLNLYADNAFTFTQLWQGGEVSGTGVAVHAYMRGSDGALVFTTNAEWTGTQWARDAAGNAFRMVLAPNQFDIQVRAAALASPWNEADWTSGTQHGLRWSQSNAELYLLGTNLIAHARFAETLADFTPQENSIYGRNPPKAIGLVRTATGGLNNATVEFGYNFNGFGGGAPFGVTYSGNRMRVTLLNGMTSIMAVVCSVAANGGAPLTAETIYGYDVGGILEFEVQNSAGAAIDLTANIREISFVAFGYEFP
jgi:hypothetical protein